MAGKLGTSWVAPGQGDTWGEILHVLHDEGWDLARHGKESARTNICLTGLPLQPYDLERLACQAVDPRI